MQPADDTTEEEPVATSPLALLDRFDTYRVARDFTRLAQRLPVASSVIRDQWRRASLSVFLNVAEGAGRTSRPDPV